MCNMHELAIEVDDDRLDVPWVAAAARDGRRMVLVRKSDAWLLGHYCALGAAACPIFKALARMPD